ERHQLRPAAAPRRRPVDMVESLVLAQRSMLGAVFKEVTELVPCRVFRRAEQAAYREGAAGIRPGGACRVWLALEPAAQEPGHEGVAGAEHIVDLDRKALPDNALLKVVGDRAIVDDAA